MTPAKIKVEYVPIITDVTKKDSEAALLPAPTISDLLIYLCQLYGPAMKSLLWTEETGARSKYVLTVVNGEVVHEEEHILKDGDTVLIMPAISGG